MNFSELKKYWLVAVVVLITVLLCDQFLKNWVLNNMYLGQTKQMLGNWFFLHFTENNGMAFGLEIGGKSGKLILTAFRLSAVAGIVWYLVKQIKKKAHLGFVICISLILAGAIGNIIDSLFYGVWYSQLVTYEETGKYFLGRVVDMLYFPVIETHYPSWFPFWGGQSFIFFRPVFNIADASISTGVITIIVFQKIFFKHEESEERILSDSNLETSSVSDNNEIS